MREILFRGKRKDNGEWIEGHLIWYEDGRARINPSHTDVFCYEKDESIIQIIAHEVIPSTVGQYTGLTDKNGTKIFEGDILQYINQDNEAHCITVVFEECAFLIEDCGVTNCDLLPSYACLGFEVVGNIHDNPELLKGEAK